MYPLLLYLFIIIIYLLLFIYFVDVINCDDGESLEQLKVQLSIEHEKYKHSLSVFKVVKERYDDIVNPLNFNDPFISSNNPIYKSLVDDIHLTFRVYDRVVSNMLTLELKILKLDPHFAPIRKEFFPCYIE